MSGKRNITICCQQNLFRDQMEHPVLERTFATRATTFNAISVVPLPSHYCEAQMISFPKPAPSHMVSFPVSGSNRKRRSQTDGKRDHAIYQVWEMKSSECCSLALKMYPPHASLYYRGHFLPNNSKDVSNRWENPYFHQQGCTKPWETPRGGTKPWETPRGFPRFCASLLMK